MQKANLSPMTPSEVLAPSSPSVPSSPASPLSFGRKSADNKMQTPEVENKFPRHNSRRDKLIKQLYARGHSLFHHVRGKRSLTGQEALEPIPDPYPPMEEGEPSRQESLFPLPTQAPRYADSIPLFTISEAFADYVRKTSVESQKAQECRNYLRRRDPEWNGRPITISDEALSIYLQRTPVKYQSALDFLTARGQGESPIEIGDELLNNVILPAIEQRMQEFKREYKKSGVDFDQLSRPFRKYLPEDGALPEVVPLPPPLPLKENFGPPLPPKTLDSSQ